MRSITAAALFTLAVPALIFSCALDRNGLPSDHAGGAASNGGSSPSSSPTSSSDAVTIAVASSTGSTATSAASSSAASSTSGAMGGGGAGGGDPVFASCADALKKGMKKSAVLTLDDGAQGTYAAYCELAADQGGWTLVAKIDPTQPDFFFDAPLWEDASVLHDDKPALDLAQAKLRSFSVVPFVELRVGMVDDKSKTHWINFSLGQNFASLMDALKGGQPTPTHVGRAGWLTLLPNASLQPKVACDAEGLNLVQDANDPVKPRVRIGIHADEQQDCAYSDSMLGFGMGAKFLSGVNANTRPCGNYADFGSFARTPAFGYVMVR